MPNVRSYWEEECRYTAVADVMSRTRFEYLMKNINFVDNTTTITEAGKSVNKYCVHGQNISERTIRRNNCSLQREIFATTVPTCKTAEVGILTVEQMWGVRVPVRL